MLNNRKMIVIAVAVTSLDNLDCLLCFIFCLLTHAGVEIKGTENGLYGTSKSTISTKNCYSYQSVGFVVLSWWLMILGLLRMLQGPRLLI
jgi:hypothetical protein